MKVHCNCGKTSLVFHYDENQYEPECWECYCVEHYDYSDYNVDPFEGIEEPILGEEVSDDELPF